LQKKIKNIMFYISVLSITILYYRVIIIAIVDSIVVDGDE